jgi:SulP family sulfate permease
VKHIPEAVISGFTIGIAISIATSQLADLFGLSTTELPADFLPKLAALWAARHSFDPRALAIGLATLALIVGLRRLAPRFPGLIVAMALCSGAVVLLDLPVDTLDSRYGALPGTLPWPHLPELSLQRMTDLLPSALVIAFLAGVESLLSASVADRMIGGNTRPNAEVIANGVANTGAALFAGLPVTGAIARTATNVHAGGRTPVAGMVHALVILLVMLLAAPLAGFLAMPALAGLLLITAWNMSEPQHWHRHLAARRSDQALLVITLVLTVLTDLTLAIGVGVALGLALRLRRRQVPEADWHDPDR